jgi:hypothetical protein
MPNSPEEVAKQVTDTFGKLTRRMSRQDYLATIDCVIDDMEMIRDAAASDPEPDMDGDDE